MPRIIAIIEKSDDVVFPVVYGPEGTAPACMAVFQTREAAQTAMENTGMAVAYGYELIDLDDL